VGKGVRREEKADARFILCWESVTGRHRSNRLNYVPTLFPHVYSVNADVSNEQLIPNQLFANYGHTHKSPLTSKSQARSRSEGTYF